MAKSDTSDSSAAVVVGVAIRARREALGATQYEVARLAGLNVANFGRLERGLTNATLDTLLRTATALNTTVSELVAGIGAENLAPRDRFTVEEFLAEKERRSAPDR